MKNPVHHPPYQALHQSARQPKRQPQSRCHSSLLACIVLCILSALAAGGCRNSLPTYPPMSDTESLSLIAARLDSVRTISAPVSLKLTDADRQTVTLDGVFLCRPPHYARLRAWKLGTPVLDLTITPEGVWVYAASRGGDPQGQLASLPAEGVARSAELLTGAYFASALPFTHTADAQTLHVTGPAMGVDSVTCEIHRPTLTPRRFILGTGDHAMELRLTDYAVISDTVWARRIEFLSPGGTILMRFTDIELNGELPASAFSPPPRATRLP
jgi:outer membrane lipoprotein-sorting protein